MSLPVRILVLCTGNSARSQMAEALLTARGADRVVAASAGSEPVARVNPLAIEALEEIGIAWQGRVPHHVDAVANQAWDIVLTVCDQARDRCPIFPGGTVRAHWGMPDPAGVTGSEAERHGAFQAARDVLSRRIDRLLALDLEGADRTTLRARLDEIGRE